MRQKKILIVDDIFTNRLLLTEFIKSLGHISEQAQNGQEAIELLQKNEFDLVLMDIEMPVMNGLETTLYIRQKLPSPLNSIKIIALTAHNPSVFFDDFEEVGFDELLSKPYSLDKVTYLIENID
jgi:two-component system, response regulator, stage 0 sporulation protein F